MLSALSKAIKSTPKPAPKKAAAPAPSPRAAESSASKAPAPKAPVPQRSTPAPSPRAAEASSPAGKSPKVSQPSQAPSPRAAESHRPQVNPEQVRKTEFNTHLGAVERNFSIYDDKGGDDIDNKIGGRDIDDIANGDYDRDDVEKSLEKKGLSAPEVDEELENIESAARFFSQEKGVWKELEGNGKKTDDLLHQGSIDKVRTEEMTKLNDRKQEILNGERPGQKLDAQEVQAAVEKFKDPRKLTVELTNNGRDLSGYSQTELQVLAEVGQKQKDSRAIITGALENTIENADSLDDLKGKGYQQLIGQNLLDERGKLLDGEAAEKLDKLVESKVDDVIDTRLEGRRGDDAIKLVDGRLTEDLRGLVLDNAALQDSIAKHAEANSDDTAKKIQGIQRSDDNGFQKVGNGFKDTGKFLGNGIREGVKFYTEIPGIEKVADLPAKLQGKVIEAGGDVLAGGLKKFGADGAARLVDDGTEKVKAGLYEVGNFQKDVAEELNKQTDNFYNGAAEGAAGAVEGAFTLVGDPKSVVNGLVAAYKDPGLLLDGYKETLKKHGVAGLVGQAAFELLGTKGAGAALKSVTKVPVVKQKLDLASSSDLGIKVKDLRDSSRSRIDDIEAELKAPFSPTALNVGQGIKKLKDIVQDGISPEQTTVEDRAAQLIEAFQAAFAV